MYIKCYTTPLGKNKFKVHLWDEGGLDEFIWENEVYKETYDDNAPYKGLFGEKLVKVNKWDKKEDGLHFHDMKPHQKFLIEKYGTNDEPSKGHRELFFDIEIKIGGALTEDYIAQAPMPVTSIAYWDKTKDFWEILILDEKKRLQPKEIGNKKITPFPTEKHLLVRFIEIFNEISPDIIVGYNSDYFDIPYLYHRITRILGAEWGEYLSPLRKINSKVNNDYWWIEDRYVDIVGVESLDWMRLHRKYAWKDEPSWKLDAIGEKYVNLNKIEYEGTLDDLFEKDVEKFIEYNFRDVEILKELEIKFQYIELTKNISHKGKHNYSEVYHNSTTQDGAISAYLLDKGIIPPSRNPNPIGKKGYAGGFLFCPQAGLYKHMFDEDLTSLYPSIIISLNIGKETYVGRIIDADDRNNRLGLGDLEGMDPSTELLIENPNLEQTMVSVSKLVEIIKSQKLAISANGTMFRTNRKSAMAAVLEKWFDERVVYKNKMKKAYKSGNSEEGAKYHLLQYTQKILLNSLYGALALPRFRYSLNYSILNEAITLSGWRIIQESALFVNTHANELFRDEEKTQQFKNDIGL